MELIIRPTGDQCNLPVSCQNRVVSVSIPSDDTSIQDVVDLFRAALVAYGFHPDTVNYYPPVEV